MPNSILLYDASRGLGLALAEEWLKRGHTVIATVRSSKQTPLNDLAKEHGGRRLLLSNHPPSYQTRLPCL